MNKIKDHRGFRRFGWATIIATYLVVLAGGVVRTTGSGMGCPDWPKCFGQWVPPTQVSELPDNYLEIFLHKRLSKNERMAAMLAKLGFEQTAQQILNDPSIRKEEPFNATKTWIEYINRLLGVFTGLFILGTAALSLRFWNSDRTLSYVGIGGFVLVVFQGWIGSIVVSTNLLPWMVSVHMLLALALIALLIYGIARASKSTFKPLALQQHKTLNWVLVSGMLLFLSQIVLGTQVREEVDVIAAAFEYLNREAWIEELGLSFYIHRTYSLVILGLHGYLWYLLKKEGQHSAELSMMSKVLVAGIALEILTGATMAYFAIPKAMQPIHLLLATGIFGFQFWLWLRLNAGRFFGNDQAESGIENSRPTLVTES